MAESCLQMTSELAGKPSNISIVSFPGTNCDHDVVVMLEKMMGQVPQRVWATDRALPPGTELLFVPGGFSYGDYLRCGAMAKVSPIAKAIREFAASGGRVIGICNGFQILCELGLLPGVLLANKSTKFLSRMVYMKVDSTKSFLTSSLTPGDVYQAPIAHFEGNYFASPEELARIEANGQVVFRYASPSGEVDPENREWNPNGSAHAIAGVCNEAGNVIGFMPHPERIFEEELDPHRLTPHLLTGRASLPAGKSRALFEKIFRAA